MQLSSSTGNATVVMGGCDFLRIWGSESKRQGDVPDGAAASASDALMTLVDSTTVLGVANETATLSVNNFIAAVRSELEREASIKTAVNSGSTSAGPASAPQQSQVLAKMRSLVSQEKVRFQQDGFDLDLTYITPNIIAMGFPSHGKEAYYRNPVDEVERFFNTRHPGHYRIYNLCSEREYDQPTRFQGRFKRFPFDDHNAPCPIRLIPDLVRDATEFLRQHVDNVVAIHCKAGKGRTGVMVACLLRALESTKFRTADQALDFFANMRTADGKGVTIPSQVRYVRYYDQILSQFQGRDPPPRTVQLNALRIETPIKVSGGSLDIYFTIEESNRERMDSRRVFPGGARRVEDGGYLFSFPAPGLSLTGDLRFIVYQRNSLLSDEELFHFWLNTSLCQATERLTKAATQLDGKPAKSKDVLFCAALAVELQFTGASTRPAASSVPPGATPASSTASDLATATSSSDAWAAKKKTDTLKERGFFKNLLLQQTQPSTLE